MSSLSVHLSEKLLIGEHCRTLLLIRLITIQPACQPVFNLRRTRGRLTGQSNQYIYIYNTLQFSYCYINQTQIASEQPTMLLLLQVPWLMSSDLLMVEEIYTQCVLELPLKSSHHPISSLCLRASSNQQPLFISTEQLLFPLLYRDRTPCYKYGKTESIGYNYEWSDGFSLLMKSCSWVVRLLKYVTCIYNLSTRLKTSITRKKVENMPKTWQKLVTDSWPMTLLPCTGT